MAQGRSTKINSIRPSRLTIKNLLSHSRIRRTVRGSPGRGGEGHLQKERKKGHLQHRQDRARRQNLGRCDQCGEMTLLRGGGRPQRGGRLRQRPLRRHRRTLGGVGRGRGLPEAGRYQLLPILLITCPPPRTRRHVRSRRVRAGQDSSLGPHLNRVLVPWTPRVRQSAHLPSLLLPRHRTRRATGRRWSASSAWRACGPMRCAP